jgi:hypothetical protein
MAEEGMPIAIVVPTPFQKPRTPLSPAMSRTSDQKPRVVSREAHRRSSTSACQREGGAEHPAGCERAKAEPLLEATAAAAADREEEAVADVKEGVEEQVMAGPSLDDDAREVEAAGDELLSVR